MKKRIAILLFVLLALTLCSCGAKSMYRDGAYTAEAEDFDDTGWKDRVTVTVKGGVITAVDWNGTHKDGGEDKKTRSQNGEYVLPNEDGHKSLWYEQANSMEAALIGTQDPGKLAMDDGGVAESVSGVTIDIRQFVLLAQQALSKASK